MSRRKARRRPWVLMLAAADVLLGAVVWAKAGPVVLFLVVLAAVLVGLAGPSRRRLRRRKT